MEITSSFRKMSGERPTKVRKTKKNDTITPQPAISIEMAEPLTPEEETLNVEDGRGRSRQLTVTDSDVPFEFLPPNKKEEILKAEKIRESLERQIREKEESSSKKAKTLLGVFIGAGIGLYIAYLVKDKLFSPAVEAAIEAAASETQ